MEADENGAEYAKIKKVKNDDEIDTDSVINRNHLIFKKMCENFSHAHGYDITEYVFHRKKKKLTMGKDIAAAYCETRIHCTGRPLKKEKTEREKYEDEEARKFREWEENLSPKEKKKRERFKSKLKWERARKREMEHQDKLEAQGKLPWEYKPWSKSNPMPDWKAKVNETKSDSGVEEKDDGKGGKTITYGAKNMEDDPIPDEYQNVLSDMEEVTGYKTTPDDLKKPLEEIRDKRRREEKKLKDEEEGRIPSPMEREEEKQFKKDEKKRKKEEKKKQKEEDEKIKKKLEDKKLKDMPPDFMGLMKQMRDDPLNVLPKKKQKEIKKNSDALVCPVCLEMGRHLSEKIKKIKKEVKKSIVTRMEELLEKICEGEKTKYSDLMGMEMPVALPPWLSQFEATKTDDGSPALLKIKNKKTEEEILNDFENVQTLLRSCKKVTESIELEDMAIRLYEQIDPCIEVCTDNNSWSGYVKDEL